VGEKIASRKIPKIFLLNGSHDRETTASGLGSMTASDVILAVCGALNRQHAKARSSLLASVPSAMMCCHLSPFLHWLACTWRTPTCNIISHSTDAGMCLRTCRKRRSFGWAVRHGCRHILSYSYRLIDLIGVVCCAGREALGLAAQRICHCAAGTGWGHNHPGQTRPRGARYQVCQSCDGHKHGRGHAHSGIAIS
jgi:hypothetical protein